MSKKKLQIFISSTYLDLKEERQAAVEAILGSNHIPAGMELFKAGNVSQLETIKKWINESDLYMLILGGRYGTIDPKFEKSYTEIEYQYAVENGIPVFAVVLSDSFLHRKAAEGAYEVFEKDNKDKYEKFKELVMARIIKQVDECKDIQIATKDSVYELSNEYDLCGWVRATEISNKKFNLTSENKGILCMLKNEMEKNEVIIKSFDKLPLAEVTQDIRLVDLMNYKKRPNDDVWNENQKNIFQLDNKDLSEALKKLYQKIYFMKDIDFLPKENVVNVLTEIKLLKMYIDHLVK